MQETVRFFLARVAAPCYVSRMTAKIVPPALFQALNAETDEEYQDAFDRLDPEWHRTVQIIYKLRSHGLDNLRIQRFIHDAVARSNHPENRRYREARDRQRLRRRLAVVSGDE